MTEVNSEYEVAQKWSSMTGRVEKLGDAIRERTVAAGRRAGADVGGTGQSGFAVDALVLARSSINAAASAAASRAAGLSYWISGRSQDTIPYDGNGNYYHAGRGRDGKGWFWRTREEHQQTSEPQMRRFPEGDGNSRRGGDFGNGPFIGLSRWYMNFEKRRRQINGSPMEPGYSRSRSIWRSEQPPRRKQRLRSGDGMTPEWRREGEGPSMAAGSGLEEFNESSAGSGGVGGRFLDSPLASALFTAFLVLMVEHADELGDLAQFWMTVFGSTAACATTCAMNSKASATATATASAAAASLAVSPNAAATELLTTQSF